MTFIVISQGILGLASSPVPIQSANGALGISFYCLPGPDSIPTFDKPVNLSTDEFFHIPCADLMVGSSTTIFGRLVFIRYLCIWSMRSSLLVLDNFDSVAVSCCLSSMFLDAGDPVPITKRNVKMPR
jgi:hypothetical protein